MSDEFELLVVGGGPAGLSAARAYRDAGGGGAVAIVTDEHRMPYSRPPLTKELLRGESSEDELPIEAEAWLQEHGVAWSCGRAVGARRRRPRGGAVRRPRASLPKLRARDRRRADPAARAGRRRPRGAGGPHAGPRARADPASAETAIPWS